MHEPVLRNRHSTSGHNFSFHPIMTRCQEKSLYRKWLYSSSVKFKHSLRCKFCITFKERHKWFDSPQRRKIDRTILLLTPMRSNKSDREFFLQLLKEDLNDHGEIIWLYQTVQLSKNLLNVHSDSGCNRPTTTSEEPQVKNHLNKGT